MARGTNQSTDPVQETTGENVANETSQPDQKEVWDVKTHGEPDAGQRDRYTVINSTATDEQIKAEKERNAPAES